MTDWYDPVLGWNRQEDTGRGRIFRIAPEGHRSHVPDFDFTTADGAVEALQNPCYSVRYLAWMALNKMSADAESALKRLFGSENVRYRARALWLLTKIRGREDHYIDTAINDSDEDIRIVGLRAARQLKRDIIPLVRRLSNDPSPQVRRECAIALQHNTSPEAPALWAELASHHDGENRWYVEALGISADQQWDTFLKAWFERIGKNWNTPAGRDILWRSRAKVTPNYLAKIINSPDVDVEESKRYLRAFDFQGDSSDKVKVLKALVLKAPGKGTEKHTFVGTEALLRIDSFDINTKRKVRRSVNELLKNAEGTSQFARLVGRYQLSEHYPNLMKVAAANKDNPIGIAAIKTLLEVEEKNIISQFMSGDDNDRIVNTVEVLGNSRDRRATPFLRTAMLDTDLNWRIREQSVRVLAGTGTGTNELVALAKSGEFPGALLKVAGVAMSRSMNAELREEVVSLFPIPPMKGREPLPQMTELLVYIGNPSRGKEMFQKATCSQCHIVRESGTDFGPDLSEIGNKLSKEGLYMSILDPSAGISITYKPYLFELRDGQEITGFIVSETENKLILRMAGGVVTEYKKGDVLARRELSISAMPDDLQMLMTVDEFVDLVEYLTTLK